MYRKIWHFLRLTRPLFLLGGALLYFLGVFTALRDGLPLNLPRLVTGQILVTLVQLVTHYTNEYFDIEGDRLNMGRTWFSGGSGVLSSGALPPQAALYAARGLVVLALLALVVAGLQVPALFFYGALSLAAAWSYSAPPLALVKTGWGELAASLVVALMVPVVGYAMQSGGRVSATLLLVCFPLVLIHFAMLIAFQIPDWAADKAAGKRTLAVRLGLAPVARIHNLALLLAFAALLALTLAGYSRVTPAWIALPLAGWQVLAIRQYSRPGTARFFPLTLRAIGLFSLASLLLMAGLVF